MINLKMIEELTSILEHANPCEIVCDRPYLEEYCTEGLEDNTAAEWFIWDIDNNTICAMESDEDVKEHIERAKSYLD